MENDMEIFIQTIFPIYCLAINKSLLNVKADWFRKEKLKENFNDLEHEYFTLFNE